MKRSVHGQGLRRSITIRLLAPRGQGHWSLSEWGRDRRHYYRGDLSRCTRIRGSCVLAEPYRYTCIILVKGYAAAVSYRTPLPTIKAPRTGKGSVRGLDRKSALTVQNPSTKTRGSQPSQPHVETSDGEKGVQRARQAATAGRGRHVRWLERTGGLVRRLTCSLRLGR